MRAIRVRAWVEVVGFVMKNSFQSSMKLKSGKLAVRGWTLLQSTWPCSIYEDILQSSTKSSVVHPSTVGKSGHTDHEANRGGSAVPYDKAVALAACRQPGGCRRIPYTGERYKHREEKSGSVALRPVEIPPLYRIWRIPTAYSCSNTSSWPMSRSLCAVPGCHNSVGQMSPGRTQLLLLLN